MKDLMSRAIAFLTFDTHLRAQQISLQFSETHHKRQAEIDKWSTKTTRQQLISSYWSTHVIGHFAVLLDYLPESCFRYLEDLVSLVFSWLMCLLLAKSYIQDYTCFITAPNLTQPTCPVLKLLKKHMKKSNLNSSKNVGKPSYPIFLWHFSFMS